MRLREALDQVPDHRKSQGWRHPLGAVLSLAVCAMLCAPHSLYANAQWGPACPKDIFSKRSSICPDVSKEANGQNPPDAGSHLGQPRINPPAHQKPPIPPQNRSRQRAKTTPPENGRSARNSICAAAANQQYKGKLVAPPASRNTAHGTSRTRKTDDGPAACNPAVGTTLQHRLHQS